MSKAEKNLLDFCLKYKYPLAFIIVTAGAFLLRCKLIPFISRDMELFLLPWFEELKNNGGLLALADYPGDYNAPYMTLMALLSYIPVDPVISIKCISIFFDFMLALSALKLGQTISAKVKGNTFFTLILYTAVLFFPTVYLNSAMWGQCDSIYTTFVLLSLTFLVKEKYPVSFILLGAAFSFKLQFIFILPLYIIIYFVKKNFSIFNFLWLPLVDLILCLPAIIAGKPVIDCLLVYFNQTQTYSTGMTYNFINLYQFIPEGASAVPMLYTTASLTAVIVCGLTLIFFLHYKIQPTREQLILTGLWLLIILTFVLPGMHERYLYMGEILGILYFICFRKNAAIVINVLFNALITYAAYLFQNYTFDLKFLSIIYGINTLFFTYKVLQELLHPSGVSENLKGVL